MVGYSAKDMATSVSRARGQVLWTAIGYGLLAAAVPAFYFAPHGVLFTGAAIAGCMGLARLREGLGSRGWAATSGKITQSEVQARNAVEGGHTEDLVAAVTYDYEVAGRKHTGHKIALVEPTSMARWLVRRRLRRYPLGAVVRVYYRPDAPQHAILEPGAPLTAWLLAGAWVFAAAAVILWLERHGAAPTAGIWDGAVPLAAVAVVLLSRLDRGGAKG